MRGAIEQVTLYEGSPAVIVQASLYDPERRVNRVRYAARIDVLNIHRAIPSIGRLQF